VLRNVARPALRSAGTDTPAVAASGSILDAARYEYVLAKSNQKVQGRRGHRSEALQPCGAALREIREGRAARDDEEERADSSLIMSMIHRVIPDIATRRSPAAGALVLP
jgi:hypothetical protein